MEPVHSKENIYGSIAFVMGILIIIGAVVSLVGILFLLVALIAVVISHGYFGALIRQNSIKVSDKQYPEVYEAVKRLCNTIKMPAVPEVYIMNGAGALNAFASRLLKKDYVIIYSDIFQMAYEEGAEELEFVLCHELVHVKRKHTSNWVKKIGAMFVPFLELAYSRACEYTCDMQAVYFTGKKSSHALAMLAVGNKVHKKINLQAVIEQAENERGFFPWLVEITSTHPALPRRIKNIEASA